jgi:hypothetical protein
MKPVHTKSHITNTGFKVTVIQLRRASSVQTNSTHFIWL